jgi:hypothetical protein
LRFDCFSITIKNAVNSITFTFTSTTSNQSFLAQWEGAEDFTDDNKQRQAEQPLMEMEVDENEDSYDFDNG